MSNFQTDEFTDYNEFFLLRLYSLNPSIYNTKRALEINDLEGEWSKEDVDRISSHLGLTPQEFFQQYCVVDVNDDGYKILLRRRGEKAIAGELLSAAQTWNIDTPCVFLADNLCQVHDVKPAECAGFHCWLKEDHNPTYVSMNYLEELGYTM